MTGDVVVPVLVTFLVVNVILLVRAGAMGRLMRLGVAAAGGSPEPQPLTSTVSPAPPAIEPVAAVAAQPVAIQPLVVAVAADPVAADQVAADPVASEPPGPALAGRDALTGLDDGATWDRRIAEESARIKRYPRPVTIVRLELDGLERLAGAAGEEAGDRLVQATAETLRRLARDTDHIARLGQGTFGIIMPETTADMAAGYVARVTRACELWIQAGAPALRLAIGWAATSGEVGIAGAQRLAVERMHGRYRRDWDRPDTLAVQGSASTDRPRRPVTSVSPTGTEQLHWSTCRNPNCDHKKDHRRDRQR